MTTAKIVDLLETEHACMLRKSHDGCDGDCGACDLARDDYELEEMYTDAINIIRKRTGLDQIDDMDDMISRDKARRSIASLCILAKSDPQRALLGRAIYIIDHLPPVDAKPVIHAHWVKEEDRHNHWHCSNCENVVGISSMGARYCERCGAQMDEYDWSDAG